MTARAPRTLALAGLAAALPLVVLHLAGARPCVSVLSGTFPPEVTPAAAAALGPLYVVAWALATLVTPILLLAAGMLTVVLFLPPTAGRAYHARGR
jgi:hypothetical protein